jgi:hypothetical protein
MSKEKRESNRVSLVEHNGVVGKNCTKCSEWKPLEKFFKSSKGTGGRDSKCKECQRLYYLINADREKERSRKWYADRKGVPVTPQKIVIVSTRIINDCEVDGKECTKCNEWKPLNKFSTDKKGTGGFKSECKECSAKRFKKYYEENKCYMHERAKKWKEINRELHLDYMYLYHIEHKQQEKLYRNQNKDILRLNVTRRLARKRQLPDDFTFEQEMSVAAEFNKSCAMTGGSNIHWDHVIPLSVGHGGTTYGNMIPLRADLNQSKNDSNIFEWFEANRQRFELSQERFDNLIAYLASANAMTVEEYRDYVYWCHANPRTIDEIKHAIDGGNRQSI